MQNLDDMTTDFRSHNPQIIIIISASAGVEICLANLAIANLAIANLAIANLAIANLAKDKKIL